MKQTIFKDKYPVFSYDVAKSEISKKNIDEIIAYYKEKIDAHPIATFIATFDHYAHTASINGEINPEIKDVKNIIFCFGAEIPNSKVAAVRPRSIGVCDMGDKFVIDFMEAPNDKANDFMKKWTIELS
ncbi:MAG TPA: hypothetical protein EYG95_05235 [Campylobacterales bacterium]|nr:hypothetical protein [Campylobacterales bacterium]